MSKQDELAKQFETAGFKVQRATKQKETPDLIGITADGGAVAFNIGPGQVAYGAPLTREQSDAMKAAMLQQIIDRPRDAWLTAAPKITITKTEIVHEYDIDGKPIKSVLPR